jgi:hypothetical protein
VKYMMLIADDEDAASQVPESEQAAVYGRIAAWWDEQAAAGKIVEGHQLLPSSTPTTVRIGPDGGPTVTDGPFVESKEIVGGYGVLDVADLDEAVRIASGWPAPGSVLEIRPIIERPQA